MDKVLIAKKGYFYTNGETFSTVIRLGIHDSPDNWHEVTEAEKEQAENNTEENENV